MNTEIQVGDLIISNNNLLPIRGSKDELFKSISNGLEIGVVTDNYKSQNEIRMCFKPYISEGKKAPLLIVNTKNVKVSGSGYHAARLSDIIKLPMTQSIELTEDTDCSWTLGAKFNREVNVWALTMETEVDTYERFTKQEMVDAFTALGDDIFSIRDDILAPSTPDNEEEKINKARVLKQSARVEIYAPSAKREEYGYVALSTQNYYRSFPTEKSYNDWKEQYVKIEVHTNYQGTYVGF